MIKERVVIIIPTYNESQNIQETITQLYQTIQNIHTVEIQVLIFDSHSTDNTRALVHALQTQYSDLYFMEEPKKTGLGSAYFQAMNHALTHMHADIVMEFDADLSHQPKYIAPMLTLLRAHDVVIGSRYVPHGSLPEHWGYRRKCLSILGNYTARLFLTAKYNDFTSGFRATRRNFLQKSLQEGFASNHYAYKLHLLWSLHCHGARIVEYPIDFIDRVKGYSKLPSNSIFDALRVIFLLRYRQLKTLYFAR